jgi:hypothetical protein
MSILKEGETLSPYVTQMALDGEGIWRFSDAGNGMAEAHTICPKCSKYVSINIWIEKWKIEG